MPLHSPLVLPALLLLAAVSLADGIRGCVRRMVDEPVQDRVSGMRPKSTGSSPSLSSLCSAQSSKMACRAAWAKVHTGTIPGRPATTSRASPSARSRTASAEAKSGSSGSCSMIKGTWHTFGV